MQPGCWTRCPALREDLATRAMLSKALRGGKSENREKPAHQQRSRSGPPGCRCGSVQGLAISLGTLAQHQGADHGVHQSRTGPAERLPARQHGSTGSTEHGLAGRSAWGRPSPVATQQYKPPWPKAVTAHTEVKESRRRYYPKLWIGGREAGGVSFHVNQQHTLAGRPGGRRHHPWRRYPQRTGQNRMEWTPFVADARRWGR